VIPRSSRSLKRGGALGVPRSRRSLACGASRGVNRVAQVNGQPHRSLFHESKGGSYAPDDVEGSGEREVSPWALVHREFDGNKGASVADRQSLPLEIVDPVVLGKVRAKQVSLNDKERSSHAAPVQLRRGFCRAGVVAECLAFPVFAGKIPVVLIHVIVNNQCLHHDPRATRDVAHPSRCGKIASADLSTPRATTPGVGLSAKVATEFRQTTRFPSGRFSLDIFSIGACT